jgi:hypothetical protein
MTRLPSHYRGFWRAYAIGDGGACIEVAHTGALVVVLGYGPDGEPDMGTAEHLCELHNAWEREQMHPVGQGELGI